MEGLNAQFMANSDQFLRSHFVRFKTNSPLGSDKEGERVDDFDLSYAAPPAVGVELELFASRGKAEGSYSKKIKAYWLPWFWNETTKLELDNNKAQFFFTSELTGCRIQIAGDAAKPTVLHIAGNSGSTRKWRIKQAKEHLGPLYKESRRYSKGRDDGYSNVAFVCGYWDANLQRWRILAQETTSEDGKLILQGIRTLW
jgi:hypothetical protein